MPSGDSKPKLYNIVNDIATPPDYFTKGRGGGHGRGAGPRQSTATGSAPDRIQRSIDRAKWIIELVTADARAETVLATPAASSSSAVLLPATTQTHPVSVVVPPG